MDKGYWQRIAEWATGNSDGCTGVKDIYVECCWEHDFHFRYGHTLDGDPITFKESNAQFRRCIQSRSKLGRFSPLSWIRWAGVTLGGKHIWDRHREQDHG
jgi:hypothetical protein